MSKRTPTIFVYRDRKGLWRWRLKSSNGLIVAESGQGTRRKPDTYFFSRLYENIEYAEVVTQ